MPDDALQRYAELEQAYVEENWASVRGNGDALLEELGASDDPQAEALAFRVHVLMGHAHLYFLGETAVAEDHYRAVLTGNAEADLRRIAAEGLQRCQALPRAESGAAAETAAAAPQGPAAAAAPDGRVADPFQAALTAGTGAASPAISQPAMPWLEALPGAGVSAPEAAREPGGVAGATEAAAQPLSLEKAAVEATPAGTLPGPADAAASGTASPPMASAAAEAEPAGALAPRLEVEVVEEPELLEVVQADPELVEELDLELQRIRERRAAGRAQAEAPLADVISAASAEIAAHEGEIGMEAPLEEDESDGGPPPELSAPTIHMEAPQPEAAEAFSPAPRPGVPIEPAAFRQRQAPDLTEEDPELLAGLLRVVLRD